MHMVEQLRDEGLAAEEVRLQPATCNCHILKCLAASTS